MAMGRWRRWIRAFALSWGVLQVALPLVILFADAQSALRSSHVVRHVEPREANTCLPTHTDECALCRFLSHNGAPTPKRDAPALLATAGFAPSLAPQTTPCGENRRLPDSRGPPTA